MANYILRTILGKEAVLHKDENEVAKKIADSGSGDFDYDSTPFVTSSDSLPSTSKYKSIPLERCLHKQAQNINTLVKSLEQEIAESKEDIRYLHNHIYNAEEVFPKRWEACHFLKGICKEHVDTVSMEILKWKRKSERIDIEMKQSEQRIGSWQYVINRAKEVQIQEEDIFD